MMAIKPPSVLLIGSSAAGADDLITQLPSLHQVQTASLQEATPINSCPHGSAERC